MAAPVFGRSGGRQTLQVLDPFVDSYDDRIRDCELGGLAVLSKLLEVRVGESAVITYLGSYRFGLPAP